MAGYSPRLSSEGFSNSEVKGSPRGADNSAGRGWTSVGPTRGTFEMLHEPWPGGSDGWSVIPYTKWLPVRSPVRAHT